MYVNKFKCSTSIDLILVGSYIINKTNREVIYNINDNRKKTKYNDSLTKAPSSFYNDNCIFELKFHDYFYRYIYYPELKTYKRCLFGKMYYLYLNVNIRIINKTVYNSPYDRQKLINYCIRSESSYFNGKIPLELDIELKDFINLRESQKLSFFNSWTYYKLNDKYHIDLSNCKTRITETDTCHLYSFKRYGAIIETDDVRKIIQSFNLRKTLVIVPKLMIDIYNNDLYHIICHEDLVSYGREQYELLQNFRYLIIHECYESFLLPIKKLLKQINIECLWLINSLPFIYYLENSDTVTYKDIFSYLNLWIGVDNKFKENNRHEIMKMVKLQLSNFYQIINFQETNIKTTNSIHIK